MKSQRMAKARISVSLGRTQDATGFGFGAGVLEQLGIIDTSRAGGHAGQAAEAEIHLFGERPGHLQPAVGHGPHQGNASARAVALDLGRVVGRASGQAQARNACIAARRNSRGS